MVLLGMAKKDFPEHLDKNSVRIVTEASNGINCNHI
jgi:hypothetical protein